MNPSHRAAVARSCHHPGEGPVSNGTNSPRRREAWGRGSWGRPAHWIGVENTLIGAAIVVVLATTTVIAVADVRNLRRVERPVPLPTRPSAETPLFLAPSPAAG